MNSGHGEFGVLNLALGGFGIRNVATIINMKAISQYCISKFVDKGSLDLSVHCDTRHLVEFRTRYVYNNVFELGVTVK